MTTRRDVLIAFGAGAFAHPLPSFAQQQGKVWRVGVLSTALSGNDELFETFRQHLRDLRYVEGKTVAIDYLSAEGKYERLPALAADLVRRNVDVILTIGGTPPIIVAKNVTRTIPLVFTGVSDPVGQGIVSSLARPGGNVTGATNQNRELAPKRLALLKEIVPSARRIAILTNTENSSLSIEIQEMQAAAKTLRLELTVVNASAPAQFEKAFAEIVQDRPPGLVILSDSMFSNEAGRLVTLAAKYRLPTIGAHPRVPESGGLMSYSGNRLELMIRAAALVDKILKGAKPADLPVEQHNKFDFIVNMKTAKALGVTIPPSILVQVTKVIE